MDKRKTKVMGILNITPDSFSDGGRFIDENDKLNIDATLYQVDKMVSEGADIIDIGGESTRPGAEYINADRECNRIIPVIEAIRSRYDIEISVDTYKAIVAKYAYEAGANIINDIGMMKLDEDMISTVASLNVKYVLMHNKLDIKGNIVETRLSGTTPGLEDSDEYLKTTISELKAAVKNAIDGGIASSNIILDPGIGFNKSHNENLWLLKNLNELCKLDFPVLLGCSRKSVIGNTLDLDVNQRLEGTLATSVLAAMAGVEYVRVHDIKENVRALRMAEAIIYS